MAVPELLLKPLLDESPDNSAEREVLVEHARELLVFRVLDHVNQTLWNADSLEDAYDTVVEMLIGELQVSFAGLWCVSADQTSLELSALAGTNLLATESGRTLKSVSLAETTLLSRVAGSWDAFYSADIGSLPAESLPEALFTQGWNALACLPILADGSCLGVLTVGSTQEFADGTLPALKRTARRIAESQPRLRQLNQLTRDVNTCRQAVRHAPVAVIELDLNSKIVSWNPAAELIFGYRRDEILDNDVSLILEANQQQQQFLWDRANAGRVTGTIELEGRQCDGDEIPVALTAAPLRAHHDHLTGLLLFVEKRKELVALNQQVGVHNIVATSLLNADSVTAGVTAVLESMCRGFGWRFGMYWSRDDTQSGWQPMADWRSPVIADKDDALAPLCQDAAHTAELPNLIARHQSVVWVSEFTQASGGDLHRELARCGCHDLLGVPIVEKGQVIGVLAFLDFTIESPDEPAQATLKALGALTAEFVKWKRIKQDVHETEINNRQSQKMESIGQLAGGIAHDFNNLLTVILGHCEIVMEMIDESSTVWELIDEVNQAGQRAAGLTRQLLAFSRRNNDGSVVCNLNAHVTDMQGMLRRLIGPNMELNTTLADGLHRIKIDPVQLEQILLNLVVNARDAMPEEGRISIETANITLTPPAARLFEDAHPGDYVQLAVTDTGCGMDEATKNRIFDPFFTTKEIGKGTGMGLSTVFGIVRQNAGTIRVDSTPGTGTTFTLLFPSVSLGITPIQSDAGPVKLPGGDETIFVIEDENVLRALVVRILEARGYTVIEAACGTEAIRIFPRYKDDVQLILSDVIMPGPNGPTLVETLLQGRSDIPVIFMSGYINTEALQEQITSSGWPLIEKPFNIEELSNAVRDSLDRQRVKS